MPKAGGTGTRSSVRAAEKAALEARRRHRAKRAVSQRVMYVVALFSTEYAMGSVLSSLFFLVSISAPFWKAADSLFRREQR